MYAQAATSSTTCTSTWLVNSLKGVSARLLRKDYDAHVRRYLWGGHFWSGSYFAGSCGGATLTVVQQYIERQQRPVS